VTIRDAARIPERTALYRLFDADDRLLYLGIAKLPEFRWARHAHVQPWWHLVARKTVVWYPSRGEAAIAEEELTATEKPLYDRSAEGVKHHAVERFDDTDGHRRVLEWLKQEVERIEPGARLMTGQVASACGVARTTASFAMHEFSQGSGRLRFLIHGRYIVEAAADPDADSQAA
jgi:hypothetical protein